MSKRRRLPSLSIAAMYISVYGRVAVVLQIDMQAKREAPLKPYRWLSYESVWFL
jgi:hypothetical protein